MEAAVGRRTRLPSIGSARGSLSTAQRAGAGFGRAVPWALGRAAGGLTPGDFCVGETSEVLKRENRIVYPRNIWEIYKGSHLLQSTPV